MILYEVNLEVRDEILADYRPWLAEHVRAMLRMPGFVSAEVFERRDPPPPDGTHALTVQYRLVDEAALDRYLMQHALRMREDGLRRFGDGFTATRRVLAA
jgi:quinol monooxygenase YgiN